MSAIRPAARGHGGDAPDEARPLVAALGEHPAAALGQLVVASPRPPVACPPRRLERSARLEGVKRRVQRSLGRGECTTASLPYPRRNLVAIELAIGEDRQDEERRCALEELRPEEPRCHRRPLATSHTAVSVFN